MWELALYQVSLKLIRHQRTKFKSELSAISYAKLKKQDAYLIGYLERDSLFFDPID